MDPFSVGLPNQRVTSGYQVGDMVQGAEISSWYTRNNGNELWLKHGVILAAAGFPQAKLVDYLRTHGLAGVQANTLNTGSANGEYATDGAGKWVFAFGHSANVLVSTDNQRNWAVVAHNCASAVTSVTYSSALTLFIGGGNTATTFNFCSQTQANVATAWTIRTGTAISTGTSDTTLVRAGPNEVVAVCVANGAGTGQASYSTNGTAWTAKNFAGGLATTGLNTSSLVNAGGSNWYYAQNSSTAQKSIDGQTWTNQTIPASNHSSTVYAFSQLWQVDQTGNLYASPLGTTGTWANYGTPLTSNRIRKLAFDGTRLLATMCLRDNATFIPAFAWSLDGSSWFVRGVAKSWPNTVEHTIGAYGDTLGFMPYGSASAVGMSYASFSNPDFIGVPWASSSNPGATTGSPHVTYSKVRG